MLFWYILFFRPRLELMQETHASFFSLLRDIICSTPDHRMSLAQLEDRVKAWAESPISPLNDWYSLAVQDIHAWLTSSLAFLAGEYTGMYVLPNLLVYAFLKHVVHFLN